MSPAGEILWVATNILWITHCYSDQLIINWSPEQIVPKVTTFEVKLKTN